MIKKIAILAIVAGALGGCATTYRFEGHKYNTKEEMYVAMDNYVSRTLSTVTPLPVPLTQKKLIFAIPSAVAFSENDFRNYANTQGKELTEPQKVLVRDLTRGNVKTIKLFFDAIQKKHIFQSVQFVEMESTTGSFAASPDADTLFLNGLGENTSQWFYTTHKHGKQIFAYDRSSPTAEGKVQAFLDAVQVQVIRD
jgi:hypothetical protein